MPLMLCSSKKIMNIVFIFMALYQMILVVYYVVLFWDRFMEMWPGCQIHIFAGGKSIGPH